jgi:hypothetical protein
MDRKEFPSATRFSCLLTSRGFNAATPGAAHPFTIRRVRLFPCQSSNHSAELLSAGSMGFLPLQLNDCPG